MNLLSAARMKMENQKGAMGMENQRTKLAKGQPDSTTTAVVTWQMDVDNVIALKNGRKLETATSLFATPITRLQYLKLMAPDRNFAATFVAKTTNSMIVTCARASSSGTSPSTKTVTAEILRWRKNTKTTWIRTDQQSTQKIPLHLKMQ